MGSGDKEKGIEQLRNEMQNYYAAQTLQFAFENKDYTPEMKDAFIKDLEEYMRTAEKFVEHIEESKNYWGK